MEMFHEACAWLRAPDEERQKIIQGDRFPWLPPYSLIRIPYNHLILLAGQEGSGKSKIASQYVAYSVCNGGTWLVLSLEVPIKDYLKPTAFQCLGETLCEKVKEHAEEDAVAPIFQDMLSHIKMFVCDQYKEATLDDIIEVMDYSRQRFGVDYILIDNLTNLGVELDDYNGQKKIVNMLMRYAMANNVQIFLVAHCKKPQQLRRNIEDSVPTNADVAGSYTLTAIPQCVLTLWRNFHKEAVLNGDTDKMEIAEHEGREYEREGEFLREYEKVLGQPDGVLNIGKMRGDGYAVSSQKAIRLQWCDTSKRYENWSKFQRDPDAESYIELYRKNMMGDGDGQENMESAGGTLPEIQPEEIKG